MVVKNRAKKDMTKAELIESIKRKIRIVKPFIKDPFVNSLKYKNKKELARINRRIRADGKYGMYL